MRSGRRTTALLVMVVLIVPVGCKDAAKMGDGQPAAATETPAPAVKQVSSVMGYDVSRKPADCKEEKLLKTEFKFKTKTCILEDGDKQKIYAQFLDDDAFRDSNGMLLKTYAIISRSISDDPTALNGYVSAFQEKYGQFVPDALDAPTSLRVCDASGKACYRAFATYDARKQYNSEALAISDYIARRAPSVFVEVAVWNADLLSLTSATVAKQSDSEARKLVK